AAAFGVVEPAFRTKALLHDLRGAVYAEFADVRIRAKPGVADFLPRAAGSGWRRTGSGGTGYLGRYVSGQQKGGGLCAVQYGHCDGAGDRATAGRMDYGSLELALGIFHQHPDRDCVVDPHQQALVRPAGIYAGSGSGAQRQKTEARRMGNLLDSDG